MSEQEPGYFGPAPEGEPLTSEQVAELADGTPVTIIWSGGNGPHDYVIGVRSGRRYATSKMPGSDRIDWGSDGPIRFVGQRRPFTRVWRR